MGEINKTILSNLLLIIGIVILMVSAFFVGRSTVEIEKLKSVTGMVTMDIDDKQPQFRVYTKALCYKTSKNQVCNDVLFAMCDGKEYALPINLSQNVIANQTPKNKS